MSKIIVPTLGDLPGLLVGDTFRTRDELAAAGVHRQTVRGISWSTGMPAESIVLSGAYEDDIDWGETILYTGMGRTQDGDDQKLTFGNLALVRSMEARTPVRVIRSSKAKTEYSPDYGLRYDGLFRVVDAFFDRSLAGPRVWRFVLIAIESLPVLPAVSRCQRLLVEAYKGSCQVCMETIRAASGLTAFAAPVVPLTRPHNGIDDWSNLLCLCPNHSFEFQAGTLVILPNLQVQDTGRYLQTLNNHNVKPEYLSYRKEKYASGLSK